MSATQKRNFGLDVMRFTAIIIVLIHHWTQANLTHYPPTSSYAQYFSLFGYYGVEIFFVLSGFLIGNIIIKSFINSSYNFESVRIFWARRWMRTLPLYYFILVLNILYALSKRNPLDSLWKYFFFIQNIFGYITTNKDFFGESWSLAIEEWFYLSFPILLIIINSILKNRLPKPSILKWAIISYLLIPTIIRFLLVFLQDPSWNNVLRKAVICREDSIAYGLLAAYIFNLHTKHVAGYIKPLLLAAGALLLVICGLIFCHDIANDYYYKTGNVSLFAKTILFSMVSFGVLLTMPFFYALQTKHTHLKTLVTFISKISYSLYLVHLFVLRGTLKFIPGNNIKSICLRMLFFFVLSTLISYLTFTFIENKFLLLRDKIWKEKYKPV